MTFSIARENVTKRGGVENVEELEVAGERVAELFGCHSLHFALACGMVDKRFVF